MTTSFWSAQPISGEWNTSENWSPVGLPKDLASFATSTVTSISFSLSETATVEAIEFSDDASAYTFTFGTSSVTPAKTGLVITGAGVKNESGKLQSFIVSASSSGYQDAQLTFTGSANAGNSDTFYCAGPESKSCSGGGVISFCQNASAGSASFKAWTGQARPPENSTVGGEISFCDTATADCATFTIYGTLGSDGDTFGNVVFHGDSSAANATFNNVGGTVSGGDGGNTQFYDTATAANGLFHNYGGTYEQANGGDVAFDGQSCGAQGYYYNYAAKAANAYGGVTSFNNNPPNTGSHTNQIGASAGKGHYVTYGARDGEQGGGGHIEFSAKHGYATADQATIHNYGSVNVASFSDYSDTTSSSCAGHTIFSMSQVGSGQTQYFPTAAQATISNHPALEEGGAAGYTEFSVYSLSNSDNTGLASSSDVAPTAGNATVINLGGNGENIAGGYTSFGKGSSAGEATLIAYGGSNGGYGGKISFYDNAEGAGSSIQLFGNGELELGYYNGTLAIESLTVSGGTLSMQVMDSAITGLQVSDTVTLTGGKIAFYFWAETDTYVVDQEYPVLTCPNLSVKSEDLTANTLEISNKDGYTKYYTPNFSISDSGVVNVTFSLQ